MVEPISMAMIGMSAVKGVTGFFEGQREKAFLAAAAEAQIQALQDRIEVERLKGARQERLIAGQGAIAAGSVGVQFRGSIRTATNQAIQDNEFEKLVKISDLKYQQRLQELRAASGISEIGMSQIAGGIETIGSTYKNVNEIESKAATNRQLDGDTPSAGRS
jgi:hypothetical protein